MPQGEPEDLDDVTDAGAQHNLMWKWAKARKRREKAVGDARRQLIELAKAIGALGVLLGLGKAGYEWLVALLHH